MLADLGFSPAQARKAFRETVCGIRLPSSRSIILFTDFTLPMAQSGVLDRSVEWLFSHADELGEEEGASIAAANSSGNDPAQNNKAAATLPGSPALPARYRLRAFLSHKGLLALSGHYVAHILTEKDGWVHFDDERVVRADAESVAALKPLAYLYIFERERPGEVRTKKQKNVHPTH
jgi:ubiquitin carboxyl-terminal hydrolase 5/13